MLRSPLTMPDKSKLTKVIARCHRGLDEVFLMHQEAVLLGMFDEAAQLLDCFKELHHLHMSFEEEKLIPRLDGLGIRGRWPASLYTDEHAKVKQLLGKTENNLLSLIERNASNRDLRREIIVFLDTEKSFKGLCEHHQEREEAGLLPELEKQADEKWCASVIEPFENQWNACMKRNMKIIDGIDFP